MLGYCLKAERRVVLFWCDLGSTGMYGRSLVQYMFVAKIAMRCDMVSSLSALQQDGSKSSCEGTG